MTKKGKYTGSVFTALLAVDLYSPDDSKITVFKVLFFFAISSSIVNFHFSHGYINVLKSPTKFKIQL